MYTKRKWRWLENLQSSLEKEVSKERVRGILEQIVVCPGQLAAPRRLKGKNLVNLFENWGRLPIWPLKKMLS